MIFGLFGFSAMGVRGAAIATIVGQFCACILSIILFCRHSGGIHIHMKGFRMRGNVVRQLYLVAVPSTVMMSLPSILIGVLNGILGAGFIVSTLGTVFAGVFESMGKGIESLIVSLLRQLIIIVPCSLILINVMGVVGVWITFPISEAVAALVASLLLYRAMKKI